MGPHIFWQNGMFIFPIIGMVFCIGFMFMFFFSARGFWGCGPLNWRNRSEKYHGNQMNPESAMDIIKKRYARGEITKEDFENMKKDIM